MESQEIERIVDALDAERIITESTFCGGCGYNLRTLHYIGICPECGRHYNARPLKLENIFIPYGVVFPYSDIVASLATFGLAYAMARSVINGSDPSRIVFVVMFAVLGGWFGYNAVRRVQRFLRAQAVLKRIESDEGEWSDTPTE